MADDTYTVQPGESWASIAGKIYGDQREFWNLYQSNPQAQGGLQPGMTLYLPKAAGKGSFVPPGKLQELSQGMLAGQGGRGITAPSSFPSLGNNMPKTSTAPPTYQAPGPVREMPTNKAINQVEGTPPPAGANKAFIGKTRPDLNPIHPEAPAEEGGSGGGAAIPQRLNVGQKLTALARPDSILNPMQSMASGIKPFEQAVNAELQRYFQPFASAIGNPTPGTIEAVLEFVPVAGIDAIMRSLSLGMNVINSYIDPVLYYHLAPALFGYGTPPPEVAPPTDIAVLNNIGGGKGNLVDAVKNVAKFWVDISNQHTDPASQRLAAINPDTGEEGYWVPTIFKDIGSAFEQQGQGAGVPGMVFVSKEQYANIEWEDIYGIPDTSDERQMAARFDLYTWLTNPDGTMRWDRMQRKFQVTEDMNADMLASTTIWSMFPTWAMYPDRKKQFMDDVDNGKTVAQAIQDHGDWGILGAQNAYQMLYSPLNWLDWSGIGLKLPAIGAEAVEAGAKLAAKEVLIGNAADIAEGMIKATAPKTESWAIRGLQWASGGREVFTLGDMISWILWPSGNIAIRGAQSLPIWRGTAGILHTALAYVPKEVGGRMVKGLQSATVRDFFLGPSKRSVLNDISGNASNAIYTLLFRGANNLRGEELVSYAQQAINEITLNIVSAETEQNGATTARELLGEKMSKQFKDIVATFHASSGKGAAGPDLTDVMELLHSYGLLKGLSKEQFTIRMKDIKVPELTEYLVIAYRVLKGKELGIRNDMLIGSLASFLTNSGSNMRALWLGANARYMGNNFGDNTSKMIAAGYLPRMGTNVVGEINDILRSTYGITLPAEVANPYASKIASEHTESQTIADLVANEVGLYRGGGKGLEDLPWPMGNSQGTINTLEFFTGKHVPKPWQDWAKSENVFARFTRKFNLSRVIRNTLDFNAMLEQTARGTVFYEAFLRKMDELYPEIAASLAGVPGMPDDLVRAIQDGEVHNYTDLMKFVGWKLPEFKFKLSKYRPDKLLPSNPFTDGIGRDLDALQGSHRTADGIIDQATSIFKKAYDRLEKMHKASVDALVHKYALDDMVEARQAQYRPANLFRLPPELRNDPAFHNMIQTGDVMLSIDPYTNKFAIGSSFDESDLALDVAGDNNHVILFYKEGKIQWREERGTADIMRLNASMYHLGFDPQYREMPTVRPDILNQAVVSSDIPGRESAEDMQFPWEGGQNIMTGGDPEQFRLAMSDDDVVKNLHTASNPFFQTLDAEEAQSYLKRIEAGDMTPQDVLAEVGMRCGQEFCGNKDTYALAQRLTPQYDAQGTTVTATDVTGAQIPVEIHTGSEAIQSAWASRPGDTKARGDFVITGNGAAWMSREHVGQVFGEDAPTLIIHASGKGSYSAELNIAEPVILSKLQSLPVTVTKLKIEGVTLPKNYLKRLLEGDRMAVKMGFNPNLDFNVPKAIGTGDPHTYAGWDTNLHQWVFGDEGMFAGQPELRVTAPGEISFSGTGEYGMDARALKDLQDLKVDSQTVVHDLGDGSTYKLGEEYALYTTENLPLYYAADGTEIYKWQTGMFTDGEAHTLVFDMNTNEAYEAVGDTRVREALRASGNKNNLVKVYVPDNGPIQIMASTSEDVSKVASKLIDSGMRQDVRVSTSMGGIGPDLLLGDLAGMSKGAMQGKALNGQPMFKGPYALDEMLQTDFVVKPGESAPEDVTWWMTPKGLKDVAVPGNRTDITNPPPYTARYESSSGTLYAQDTQAAEEALAKLTKAGVSTKTKYIVDIPGYGEIRGTQRDIVANLPLVRTIQDDLNQLRANPAAVGTTWRDCKIKVTGRDGVESEISPWSIGPDTLYLDRKTGALVGEEDTMNYRFRESPSVYSGSATSHEHFYSELHLDNQRHPVIEFHSEPDAQILREMAAAGIPMDATVRVPEHPEVKTLRDLFDVINRPIASAADKGVSIRQIALSAAAKYQVLPADNGTGMGSVTTTNLDNLVGYYNEMKSQEVRTGTPYTKVIEFRYEAPSGMMYSSMSLKKGAYFEIEPQTGMRMYPVSTLGPWTPEQESVADSIVRTFLDHEYSGDIQSTDLYKSLPGMLRANLDLEFETGTNHIQTYYKALAGAMEAAGLTTDDIQEIILKNGLDKYDLKHLGELRRITRNLEGGLNEPNFDLAPRGPLPQIGDTGTLGSESVMVHDIDPEGNYIVSFEDGTATKMTPAEMEKRWNQEGGGADSGIMAALQELSDMKEPMDDRLAFHWVDKGVGLPQLRIDLPATKAAEELTVPQMHEMVRSTMRSYNGGPIDEVVQFNTSEGGTFGINLNNVGNLFVNGKPYVQGGVMNFGHSYVEDYRTMDFVTVGKEIDDNKIEGAKAIWEWMDYSEMPVPEVLKERLQVPPMNTEVTWGDVKSQMPLEDFVLWFDKLPEAANEFGALISEATDRGASGAYYKDGWHFAYGVPLVVDEQAGAKVLTFNFKTGRFEVDMGSTGGNLKELAGYLDDATKRFDPTNGEPIKLTGMVPTGNIWDELGKSGRVTGGTKWQGTPGEFYLSDLQELLKEYPKAQQRYGATFYTKEAASTVLPARSSYTEGPEATFSILRNRYDGTNYVGPVRPDFVFPEDIGVISPLNTGMRTEDALHYGSDLYDAMIIQDGEVTFLGESLPPTDIVKELIGKGYIKEDAVLKLATVAGTNTMTLKGVASDWADYTSVRQYGLPNTEASALTDPKIAYQSLVFEPDTGKSYQSHLQRTVPEGAVWLTCDNDEAGNHYYVANVDETQQWSEEKLFKSAMALLDWGATPDQMVEVSFLKSGDRIGTWSIGDIVKRQLPKSDEAWSLLKQGVRDTKIGLSSKGATEFFNQVTGRHYSEQFVGVWDGERFVFHTGEVEGGHQSLLRYLGVTDYTGKVIVTGQPGMPIYITADTWEEVEPFLRHLNDELLKNAPENLEYPAGRLVDQSPINIQLRNGQVPPNMVIQDYNPTQWAGTLGETQGRAPYDDNFFSMLAHTIQQADQSEGQAKEYEDLVRDYQNAVDGLSQWEKKVTESKAIMHLKANQAEYQQARQAIKTARQTWMDKQEQAMIYAISEVRRVLFNYNSGRSEAEEMLRYYSPFTTWQLRNPFLWAQMFSQHPSLMGMWGKMQFQSEMQRRQKNLSTRFSGTAMVNTPDGGVIGVKPSPVFSIYQQFQTPFEMPAETQLTNGQTYQEWADSRTGLQKIMQWMTQAGQSTGIAPWPFLAYAGEKLGYIPPGSTQMQFGPVQRMAELALWNMGLLQPGHGLFGTSPVNDWLIDFHIRRRISEIEAEGTMSQFKHYEFLAAMGNPDSEIYQQAYQDISGQLTANGIYSLLSPFPVQYASPGEVKIRENQATLQAASTDIEQQRLNAMYPYLETYRAAMGTEETRASSEVFARYEEQMKPYEPWSDKYKSLVVQRSQELDAIYGPGETPEVLLKTYRATPATEEDETLYRVRTLEPRASQYMNEAGKVDWDTFQTDTVDFYNNLEKISEQVGTPIDLGAYLSYRYRNASPKEVAYSLYKNYEQEGYQLNEEIKPGGARFEDTLNWALKEQYLLDISAGFTGEEADKLQQINLRDWMVDGLPYQWKQRVLGEYLKPINLKTFSTEVAKILGIPANEEMYALMGQLDVKMPNMYGNGSYTQQIKNSYSTYYYGLTPAEQDQVDRYVGGKLSDMTDADMTVAWQKILQNLETRAPNWAVPVMVQQTPRTFLPLPGKLTEQEQEEMNQVRVDWYHYSEAQGQGLKGMWTPLMEKYYSDPNAPKAKFWSALSGLALSTDAYDDPVLGGILNGLARSTYDYTDQQYTDALAYWEKNKYYFIDREMTKEMTAHPDWLMKANQEQDLFQEVKDIKAESLKNEYYAVPYAFQEEWRTKYPAEWKSTSKYIVDNKLNEINYPYYTFFFHHKDYVKFFGEKDPVLIKQNVIDTTYKYWSELVNKSWSTGGVQWDTTLDVMLGRWRKKRGRPISTPTPTPPPGHPGGRGSNPLGTPVPPPTPGLP